MSRTLSLSKLAFLCSLVALIVSAIGAASASAEPEPFKSPSLKVCKEVPSGALGLYTESKCATNVRSGNWDWATADTKKNTWFCLLWTTGSNRYSDSLCATASATGQFEAKLFANVAFPGQLGTGGLAVLKGTVAGAEAQVDCTKNAFTGQPETGSLTGEAKITYTGCTAVKPKECSVNSVGQPVGTIVTENLKGHLASAKLVTFVPESGVKFVVLEYTGAGCVIKEQKPSVEGSQMCNFTSDIETPAVEHTLVCVAGESNLKLGGNAATYTGNSLIMIAGSLLWKIK